MFIFDRLDAEIAGHGNRTPVGDCCGERTIPGYLSQGRFRWPDTANKAVVCSSGGLDSATTLAVAIREGFLPCAMSFRYGQRHARELESAGKVADAFGVSERMLVSIDLGAFGGSALTSGLDVPKDRTAGDMDAGIPVTYVPARNTIFLSYALGWAEVIGAHDIFIGVHAVDYSGYRIAVLRSSMRSSVSPTWRHAKGRGTPVRIHAPLIDMTKAQIIKNRHRTGVGLFDHSQLLRSTPGGFACGRCDSCIIRRNGFVEGGVPDPNRIRLKSRKRKVLKAL